MRIRMSVRPLRSLRRVVLSQLWISLLFATPALSQDVLITGEVSDGGIYKLLFPGIPLKTSKKNALYENIVTTTYHWTDEKTEVFLYINDDHKHQQLDLNDKDVQERYLSLFLSHYEIKYSPAFLNTGFTEFTYRQNTPFELKGLRTEVHELKSDRKGAIYSLYTGSAGYGLLILGMSVEEASPYVESLELAPYPSNDISLQQDLSKKVSTLLQETIPYQSPPHPKRILAPQTGGWDYIHAPPEKAVAPGTIPTLDPHFEQCREGIATACDELVRQAYLHLHELSYEARPYLYFGRTCGGRTLDQYCRTLLHGELVTPGTDVTPMWRFSQYQRRNEQLNLTMIAPPNSAPPQTRSAALDLLWLECGINAQPESCDELDKRTGLIDLSLYEGGAYSAFAQSCGGRTTLIEQDCQSVINPDSVSKRGTESILVPIPELDALMTPCRLSNDRSCYQLHSKASKAWIAEKAKHGVSRYKPYFDFGKTCGGVVDRPVTRRYCGDFSKWPTVRR